MGIEIGTGHIVSLDSLIGIFDIDNCTQSSVARDFLRRAQDNNMIGNTIADIPRSFIVFDEVIYLSGIRPSTLKKRITDIDEQYIDKTGEKGEV